MLLASRKTGVGCIYLGLWLLATSALLVYAQTAPSITAPDFTGALLCLAAGVPLFYAGYLCCSRARRDGSEDSPMR